MFQVAGQRYFVEGGRILQQVQLVDPDTGEEHSTVQDTGVDAPPGSEGEYGDTPDDLADKLERGTGLPSNDYDFNLTPPADRIGAAPGSGFGQSMAAAARGAYGGGLPQDTAAATGNFGAGAAAAAGGQQVARDDNRYLNQNAGTAAATAAARQGTGGPMSDVPGDPDPTGARGRALTLYNEEDPQAALQNTLLDRGLNPFNAGNPMIAMMMRAAPALAMAFRIANANQEGVTGQSVYDAPYAFKDFLGNAIAQGKTLTAGPAAAQQIPAIIDKIRGLADQAQAGAGGPTAGGIGGLGGNPFIEIMNQLLGKDFGGGTTDILAALMGPAMTRGTAAGYRSGLNRALSMAQRNYDFGAEAKGEKTDIYKFLFGPGGGVR